MATEPWSVLGAIPQKPIYVSMSGTAAAGAATSTQEEFFSSSNTANSLSEYLTTFSAGTQGFESASVIKASAGKLYQIIATNPSGGTLFLQLFNLATSPVSAAFPLASYAIPLSSSLTLNYRSGKAFATGITTGFSTVYSAFSGVAAGSVQAFYK